MDFSSTMIEAFKRKAKRLTAGAAATMIAGAVLAPHAAQADISDTFMNSDVAPGNIYVGHMVLGAADGLKYKNLLGEVTVERVENLRDEIINAREYLGESEKSALLEVQRTGYEQASKDQWTEVSLNSYMDALEFTDVAIYEQAAKADSEGIFLYPLPDDAWSSERHTMSAAAMIFDISNAYADLRLDSKADHDAVKSGILTTAGNNVIESYKMLGDGVGPEFLSLGHAAQSEAQLEDVDPFTLSPEANALLDEADPLTLSPEASALLEEADPFALSPEAAELLDEAVGPSM